MRFFSPLRGIPGERPFKRCHLYQQKEDFAGEEHLKRWLLRVAVNESRKVLRSPWRKRNIPLEDWDAAAAEVPAVQEFFATVFVTISTNGDVAAGLNIPSVSVEEREGRSILIVDGEETDVTDALAKDGKYLYEGDGFEVEVDEHGAAIVTAYGADGTVVSYSTQTPEGQNVVYTVTGEDGNGQPITYEASDGSEDDVSWGEYNVVVDQSGAMDVSPAEK